MKMVRAVLSAVALLLALGFVPTATADDYPCQPKTVYPNQVEQTVGTKTACLPDEVGNCGELFEDNPIDIATCMVPSELPYCGDPLEDDVVDITLCIVNEMWP